MKQLRTSHRRKKRKPAPIKITKPGEDPRVVTAHEFVESNPITRSRSRRRRRGKQFTAAYREYIASPAWRAKRQLVLERDGFCCRGCGIPISLRTLQVHHLTYANFRNEPLEDLITLCIPCHEKTHGRRLRK